MDYTTQRLHACVELSGLYKITLKRNLGVCKNRNKKYINRVYKK